ncbi:MAG: mRNA surveillance protein pelota [Candidatus Marsarchaeota archaeon]|nr:mRNA surveillance protein pelota [Candidatus Marsarchaeota archaeon]MCL5413377.1 mRNA surveillance protein pelota [Candidatus Marsarchaeota archaeon]
MRVIRFNNVSSFLKVEPQSIEDLYVLAIIISKNDVVESRTTRRFRPNEGDIGEQKDVLVRITVERSEIDKNAGRLRLSGKIVSGKPEEFVTLGSYHTLNIAAGDVIDVHKGEWKDYILKRIRQAVIDSKRPRLGIIVLDDEKALVAYIKGYGIEIVSELYSRLSKRMKMKDFERQREEYFKSVIAAANNLSVDIVVIAGPGFTKDDIRKYVSDMGIEIKKRLVYAPASDAERSGIREVMQSDTVSKVLENEHVRREFEYMNRLMIGIRTGSSFYGIDGIRKHLDKHVISAILVNDDIINDGQIKELLDNADKLGIHIEIFNSQDDAGIQLKNFKGIATT